MLGRKLRTAVTALAFVWSGGTVASVALAQDMPPAVVPAPPAPAPSVVAPSAAPQPAVAPATHSLSQAQLDQLVAPVALYPDPLLGHVLMASTYPLQVVEAAHWTHVSANRGLSAAALTAALRSKEWDPAVSALVPFPALLAIMADKLEWTEQLGEAVLAQQPDVMAEVQHLRHAALAAGNLKATPECHCIIQTSGEIIAIRPVDPELLSIPVYNPTVAYGTWANSGHPPVVFPVPAGFAFAPAAVVGFAPAIEVALYGPLWGWGSIDWPNRRIAVDKARYAAAAPGRTAFADSTWVHDSTPRHATALNLPPTRHRGIARGRVASGGKRLASAHPPRAYGVSRHHVAGLPPGTIVPPPPPPHHAALGWPDYRRY